MHRLFYRARSLALDPAVFLICAGIAFWLVGSVHAAHAAVVLPVGDAVDFGSAIALSLVGQLTPIIWAFITAWGARLLGKPAWAMVSLYLTKEMVRQGIVYGINAVAGAEHGTMLTIDIANQVVAHAVDWIMAKVPALLRGFLGSPQDIAQLILAQLHIEPAHSIDQSVVRQPPVQKQMPDRWTPPAPPIPMPANAGGSATVGRAH